jgi:uncharacterized protein (TIGR03435 family)
LIANEPGPVVVQYAEGKMVKWVPTLFVLGAVSGLCQAPSFEAASIKPSEEAEGHTGWHSRKGYLVLQNQNLRQLVAIANDMTEDRVLGGPKWADLSRYYIEARAASPAEEPELRKMLQSLLAERFQLTNHRESRTVEGYSLATIKGRLKINPDPDDAEGGSKSNGGRGRLVTERISMAKLAEILSRGLGRPVVDKTDAKGVYTFTLEWNPETPRPAAGDSLVAADSSGPTIYDALAQQLGLKLESKKLPVEVIVVDQAQKPTEN